MGTRAAFWLGDPRDLENRKWLGCVAWDGYKWQSRDYLYVDTEKKFLDLVEEIHLEREDFADPECGGWPFPWDDDIFLTDITYAFYGGSIHTCYFHEPLLPLKDYLELEDTEMEDDPNNHNVPAPNSYDVGQPDSIMIISAKKE